MCCLVEGFVACDDQGYYIGTNTTNKVVVPHSDEFNAGLGEVFARMEVRNLGEGSTRGMFIRRNENGGNVLYVTRRSSTGDQNVIAGFLTRTFESDIELPLGEVTVTVLRRANGIGELWFDDVLVGTGDNISDRDLDTVGGQIEVGTTGSGWVDGIRNFQYGTSAPSPEQIKAMHRWVGDVIPGTSNAILSMDFNGETGLLWCLTSDRKFAYNHNMKLVHDEPNTASETLIVSDGLFTIGG